MYTGGEGQKQPLADIDIDKHKLIETDAKNKSENLSLFKSKSKETMSPWSHEIPGYHNFQWSKSRAHELGNPKVPLNYHNIYI